jgi:hypothetical protein
MTGLCETRPEVFTVPDYRVSRLIFIILQSKA